MLLEIIKLSNYGLDLIGLENGTQDKYFQRIKYKLATRGRIDAPPHVLINELH